MNTLGWNEAANLITDSMEKTIDSKVVTYDFARLMDGATEVKCSEFADELIKNYGNNSNYNRGVIITRYLINSERRVT